MRISFDSWSSTIAAVLVLGVVVSAACERDDRESGSADTDEPEAVEESAESKLRVRAFESPTVVDLRSPERSKRRELELSEPRRYPACRDVFESAGSVVESFLPDREHPEWVIYGCSPEAYRRLSDGRRYIAYRLQPGPSGGRDLRVIAFDESGKLEWTYRLERRDYTDHFNANFRSSFITPLLPHLVCVGTLWAGGTQASCLEPESGEPKWEGDLGFWSGIPLHGYDVALHGADISGLTRRYPYSGVEMGRTDFEHLGGHSALYVTDGRRLFFVPKEGKPNRLTAYSFRTLEPIWRTKLPGHPDSGFVDFAFAEHDVVGVKIDDRIYGFDANEGTVRWAYAVGDTRPSTASGPERIHLLLQRPEEANLLYALDPASGAVDWYGPVPTGTLEVARAGGVLMIRSVRAFQRVENAR